MPSENYKFMYWANKAADMVILSILWCVLSLPVVTVGASTAALYYAVVISVKEDRSYAAHAFWKAWKENIRQSLGFYTISFVCSASFAAAVFQVYSYRERFIGGVLFIFFGVCLGITLIVQLHGCFLIGRFEIHGKEFWKGLLMLSGSGMIKNILMFLTFLFAAEAVLWYPVLLFIVPSGFIYIISYMEEKRFRKFFVKLHSQEQ